MFRNKYIFTSLNNLYRLSVLVPSKHILVRPEFSVKFSRCLSKKSSSVGKDERSHPESCKPLASRRNSKTSTPQDCPPSSEKAQLQDERPVKNASPPECNVADHTAADSSKKTNSKILAAVLLAAGAVYAVWKFGPFSDEEKKEKEEKPVNVGDRQWALKVPASSSEIPSNVPYLLVGGGTASFSAFRSIKSLDPKAKVLVISNENQLPYMRPPLSKEMWFNIDPKGIKDLTFKQWNGAERSLLYEPEDFYISCKELGSSVNGGVAVARGWKVDRIDALNRIAYLDDGHQIKYDKCLVATGSKPKNLKLLAQAPDEIKKHVMLFREIPDFLALHNCMKDSVSVAIIGGGFLGSELACALARKAKTENINFRVHQIFKEPGNMHKVLPQYLSLWTTNKVREEGVEVEASAEVQDVAAVEGGLSLSLSNGKKITVNKLIVAIGVEPNTEFAEKSGLEVDSDNGGFLVNAELEARSNLYAAGDCSCFYDVKFGRRRVEHHDHAVISGRLAGENMVGAGKPYLHQSMFWSDLGPDVGYEAIGIVDSSLPTVGVFAKGLESDSLQSSITHSGDNIHTDSRAVLEAAEPNIPSSQGEQESSGFNDYRKGVVFYLRNEMVVGVVLWNLYSRMSVARQILMDNKKYDDLNEVAKLFKIFD